jgi:hypothetical protein
VRFRAPGRATVRVSTAIRPNGVEMRTVAPQP